MKLHLAYEQELQSGFQGVGPTKRSESDFVWDLEKYPWEPFKDDSVREIYCTNYLARTVSIIKFMDEIWRICENGAKITFVCNYYTSARAWLDPLRRRTISEITFLYFDEDWRKSQNFDSYPIKSNFKVEKMMVFFNTPWDKKSEEARQFAQQHYWNVISDMVTELRVVKE